MIKTTAKSRAEDSILHPNIHLGYVHLTVTVSNLERALNFYQRSLGFLIHRHEKDTAYLGTGRKDLLALTDLFVIHRRMVCCLR